MDKRLSKSLGFYSSDCTQMLKFVFIYYILYVLPGNEDDIIPSALVQSALPREFENPELQTKNMRTISVF